MALEKFEESFRKEVVNDNTEAIENVLWETNEDLKNLLDKEIQDKVSEISKETLENLDWKKIQTEAPNSDIRKLIGAVYFMEKQYNKREISFEWAKEELIKRKEKFDKSNEEYAKSQEKTENNDWFIEDNKNKEETNSNKELNNDEDEIYNWSKETYKNIVDIVKSKTYSRSDIFWDSEEAKDRYNLFFKEFWRFDKWWLVFEQSTTRYETKNGKDYLLITLDEAWPNRDKFKNIEIEMSEILDWKKFDETKFKTKLASIIEKLRYPES